MSSGPSRKKILTLYKCLVRESEKFPNYNFRSYAVRRVKDAFQKNKTLRDPKEIQKEFYAGTETLNMIRRQIIVGDLYRTEKLVIENISAD
ncbi:LYR motif-containing protein bcn92 [Anticarsia gemmatalis]|uniref:LYR motif-containing protein bcn92 n=1 Tax=Anticarsia gemmatalis TaxID=129554 RepID=UPI003F766F92